MYKTSFSILDATLESYRFVWREAGYLARIGFLPLAANLICAFYIELMLENPSIIARWLWQMPATALLAWFMFVEVRLILLGERLGARSTALVEPAETRKSKMGASVILWLLFSMGLTAAAGFMHWSLTQQLFGVHALTTAAVMLLIGALFWALRFSVLHILAAVGFPIRTFIFAVNGIGFSFRLLAMGLLCFFPVLFMFQAIATPFIEDPKNLTQDDILVTMAISAPMSITLAAVLNAAAAFALKQIFSKERR